MEYGYGISTREIASKGTNFEVGTSNEDCLQSNVSTEVDLGMWMLQTCLCARLVLACTKKSNLLRCSLFLLLHRELTDFSVMLIYINLSQTRLTCSHQIIYGLSESRCPTLKIIRCILFVGRKSRRKLIVEATQISRFAFGMTVYYSKILLTAHLLPLLVYDHFLFP